MLSGASSFHCGEEQLLSPPRRALVGLRRLKAGTLNALKDAEGLRRAPWALTVRRSSGRIEGGTAARGANTSRGRLPFFRFITEFRDGAYSESTLEAPPRVATTATAGTAKDAKDAKEGQSATHRCQRAGSVRTTSGTHVHPRGRFPRTPTVGGPSRSLGFPSRPSRPWRLTGFLCALRVDPA